MLKEVMFRDIDGIRNEMTAMAFDIQNIIVYRLPVMEIHRIRFPDKGNPKTFRRHLDRSLHAADHTDLSGRHAMLPQDRVLDLPAALPGRM